MIKKLIFIPVLIAVLVWPLEPMEANAFSLSRLKEATKFTLKDFMGDVSSDISGFVSEADYSNSVIASNNPTVPGYSRYFPKKKQVYEVTATAYSSTPDQTDATPFITASGTYTRDGVIAANFLPFGTVIKIPDIYGDKTFIVEDRMNKRYQFNIDIWFATIEEAKQFGVRKVKIEIVS